jgi:hypothetical protein
MSEQLSIDFVMEEKKRHALLLIGDLLSNYFYYDRKGDEDLSADEMQELIESGNLTPEELVEAFSKKIPEVMEQNFDLPE